MNPFDCQEFVNHHPLRYLCSKSPIEFFVKWSLSLSNRLIEYLSQWYKIPLSSNNLEEIIKSKNIITGEKTILSIIDQDSWHFFAWSDPDRNLIYIDQKALEKLASIASDNPKNDYLDSGMIRCLILAHEWFHILFHVVTLPGGWDSLKISEQKIIEEIAARIFSMDILGKSLNPFVLDDLIRKTIV